jgi:hypothetical protein
MVKRGAISKVEAFYIEKNYQTMDIAQIATDLNRPITSVETYIKKNIIKSKATSVSPKGDKQLAINGSEQFVSRDGITIMTENASMLGDIKTKKTMTKDCITKIKP